MTIIIAEKGKTAIKVDRCHFRNEAAIQDFINKNPETIPICELDPVCSADRRLDGKGETQTLI